MLDLDSPPLPDDGVRFYLKFHHWRQVCGDGIGSPYLGVNDAIQRPAQLLNGTQASQAVLAV